MLFNRKTMSWLLSSYCIE